MNSHECTLAVRLRPEMKQAVEDTIARFLEEELRIRSPVYITISLTLDELGQVTDMRTDWKTDLEAAYRLKQRMTFSRALGLCGSLCRYGERNGIRLSPFYFNDILSTFHYFLSQIPSLGEYLEITPYITPPNYTPMKLVVCHSADEGKNLLARFITECLGQDENDWFALRLNLTIDSHTGAVRSLYIGTGWVTPQWAESSDRDPSFAEKNRFQTVFADWFKTAGISPTPATPETILRFFEVMLKACPPLNEYFTIIEK